MAETKEHWRVVSEVNGRFLIQSAHFASRADAEAYIDHYRDVLVPGERSHIVEDSDARVYPVWRANRPARREDAPQPAASPRPEPTRG